MNRSTGPRVPQAMGDLGRIGWHLAYAAIAAVTAVAMLFGDEIDRGRWPVAAALFVGLCFWYVTVGRVALRDNDIRVSIGYLVGAGALTVALFWVVPIGALMLLVLYPHIWTLLRLRGALAATVVLVTGVAGVSLHDLGASRLAVVATLSVAAGSFVIAVGLGLWVHTVTEHGRRNAALVEALERTRSELAAVSHEAGTLAERERLAGEIHDTLTQGFASILLLLQAVETEMAPDPATAATHLRYAQQTARDNLAEARSLVAVLAPPPLDNGSLAEGLRRLVDRFGREAGVPATVTVAGTLPAVPASVRLALLRAAQESLANVRRHAGAGTVDLALDAVPGRLTLRVRDDGRGFEPGSGTGFGLDGIRRRVRAAGGYVRVDTAPGAGTTVTVEVPAG